MPVNTEVNITVDTSKLVPLLEALQEATEMLERSHAKFREYENAHRSKAEHAIVYRQSEGVVDGHIQKAEVNRRLAHDIELTLNKMQQNLEQYNVNA